MVFIEPLNMETIFISVLAGSIEIFTFLSLIVISALSASFRMPNIVFGVMIALFAVIMSNYIGGLYLITMIITSFLIFSYLSRLFR